MQNVKVLAVQMKVVPGEPAVNMLTVQRYLMYAKKKRVDLVIFPECFLTGFIEKDSPLINRTGEFLATLQSLAKTYGVDVVAGSVIEEIDGKLFNVSYYLDAKGNILGRHRKTYLWDTERDDLSSGDGATIVETRFGKVGLLICWDTAFADMWTSFLEAGVKLVCCPSYWSYCDAKKGLRFSRNSEVTFVNALMVARAYTNEAAVIFVNPARYAGRRRDAPIGRTQIALPFYGSYKRLNHHREGAILGTIKSKVLDIAEEVYEIRKDTRERA